MSIRKLHAHEVHTDIALVHQLLTEQFPQWADLRIEPFDSSGTDNAIYRLGDDMCVRLPRIKSATGQAQKEHRWLPKLAPLLPLRIPAPLAQGSPAAGYPWEWSVYRWFEGEHATFDRIVDLRDAAIALAEFVVALQRIDPANGPIAHAHSRGGRLGTRDASTREAIAALRGVIDTDAATAAWEVALRAPEWDRAPVWFHGDLLPGNVLAEEGRVSAVIDFGGLGVGDPACDLMIAWGLFSGESRAVFRDVLAADDATWARGRGHALSQALLYVPYYRDTNPVGVAIARHAIDEVLADQ